MSTSRGNLDEHRNPWHHSFDNREDRDVNSQLASLDRDIHHILSEHSSSPSIVSSRGGGGTGMRGSNRSPKSRSPTNPERSPSRGSPLIRTNEINNNNNNDNINNDNRSRSSSTAFGVGVAVTNTTKLLEEIQYDMDRLTEEENNLLVLKAQIIKIKKIQDEKNKKDELIEVLTKRLSALEHDLEHQHRTNKELCDIMTDRIYELEKTLLQKDHVVEDLELKIINLEVQCEIIAKDRDSLNEALQYQHAR